MGIKGSNEKKRRDKVFGNKIKSIIDEMKMSQQELADIALNGDSSHLSKIIMGKSRMITLPIAFRIARALNRPIEEVFIYRMEDEIEK